MATDLHKELVERQTGEFQFDDEPVKLAPQAPVVHEIPEIPEGAWQDPTWKPSDSVRSRTLAREAEEAGFGQSRYDVGDFNPDMDIEDRRAREQSWFAKVGNGVIKGGITAVSTAANTVAGTVWGGLSSMFELGRQAVSGESIDLMKSFDTGVNNKVSEQLLKLQNLGEELFPNYRTEEERSEKYQQRWYRPRNIFSGNFIGDSFLKNFGFTLGAMAGGSVWSKLLGGALTKKIPEDVMKGAIAAANGDAEAVEAIKQAAVAAKGMTTVEAEQLVKNINRAAKRINMLEPQLQLYGAAVSAMGEGNVEGLMAKDEFLKDYTEKAQRRYIENYDSLTAEILQNPKYILDKHMLDENGNDIIVPTLNDKGKIALMERRAKLAEDYQKEMEYANQQADRLASTTFLLNIPVLTVSNVVQFGKMFGGGWKTARQVATVKGGLERIEGAALKGSYASGVNKTARGILNAVKVGTSEAAEEMIQGGISSGAKRVADDHLSAYNDLGYDPESLDNVNDWLTSMLSGAGEYYADTANWQEGFLGALTGLIGIPGVHLSRTQNKNGKERRRLSISWNGGVPEAISSAKEDAKQAEEAAEKLNTLVNNEEFQTRWHDYIRGLAYESEMREAAEKDNEYAWHNASDSKLISDVMAFANAGKLNDLKDLATQYSKVSDDDFDSLIKLYDEQKQKEYINNRQKLFSDIQDNAKEILNTIDSYNNLYTSLRARARQDVSDKLFNEILFTAAKLQKFENRFVQMANEVIPQLRDQIRVEAEKNLKEGESVESKISEIETLIREALSNRVNQGVRGQIFNKVADDYLAKLENSIVDEEAKNKLRDMRRIAKDRENFYRKLTTLQEMSNEDFNAQAKNAETLKEEAEKQMVKEETEELTSFTAVRNAYENAKKALLNNTDVFINKLRKIRNENPYVSQFLDTFDTRNEVIQQVLKSVGNDEAARSIVEDMFNDASTPDDILNATVPDYNAYSDKINAMIDAVGADVEKSLSISSKKLSPEQYADSMSAVVNAINAVKTQRGKVEAAKEADLKRREIEKNNPKKPVQTKDEPSTAKEPSQPVSPAIGPNVKKTASLDSDGQSATDASGNIWAVGEVVYFWDSTKDNIQSYEEGAVIGFTSKKNGDVMMEVQFPNRTQKFSLINQLPAIHKTAPAIKQADEPTVTDPDPSNTVNEFILADVPESPDEVQEDNLKDKNGDKDYYQLGVPEYPVEDVKNIRLEGEDYGKKVKMIEELRPLSDNPNFKKVTEYLTRNNSTRNTQQLKEGDVIHFEYDPSLGLYDGKPQMVMYAEWGEEKRVINVMRMNQPKEGPKYANLEAFWDQVMKEYKDEYTPFTFSKTSTVWAKRKGIVVYNYTEVNRNVPINNKAMGYDKDAPIVWFNPQGQPKVIRGDKYAADSVLSWSGKSDPYYKGRMYYLTKDGDNHYIPIRLKQQHFNRDTYQLDEPAFETVRNLISQIQEASNRFFARMLNAKDEAARAEAINISNEELHRIVSDLKGNTRLLLRNKFFSFGTGEFGPTLNFITNYKTSDPEKYNRVYVNDIQIDNLPEIIADQNWTFDFLVDINEQMVGSDMPITRKNLNEYIESNLLLTNAVSLLPMNVDAYITSWDPSKGDFKAPLDKSQEEDRASGFTAITPDAGEFGPEEAFDDVFGEPPFDNLEKPAPMSSGETWRPNAHGIVADDIKFLWVQGKMETKGDKGKPGSKEIWGALYEAHPELVSLPTQRDQDLQIEKVYDLAKQYPDLEISKLIMSFVKDEAADSRWVNIPQEGKDYLERRGITQESFDNMSPEQQQHWLDCMGV